MVMRAEGVQVLPPKKNIWNELPEAINSLMSGVKEIRERHVFPEDIETLTQTSQDPATAQDPNTWLGLMGKLKTEKGKAMAYAQWQAMMKARSEYTTIYDPATGGVTQVPGKKVVVDKTAAEEVKDTRRFAQQDKLQNEKKELALQIEGLKTERQKTGITAANERQLKDLQKRDERLDKQLAAGEKKAQATSAEDIKEVAAGVLSGDIAPGQLSKRNTKGEYTKILAEVQRSGGSLSKFQKEYENAKRFGASMNSPQMVRFKGLAGSVVNTIDEVKTLAEQMKLSGVVPLNRLELESYVKLAGNSPGGQLAAKYLGAVTTLKEEFANLAMGGYAPTEPAFALANKQINENYGVEQMKASLTEVQRLINYRIQAFDELEPSMAGTLKGGTPPKGAQQGGKQVQQVTTPAELPVGKAMKVGDKIVGMFPDGLYTIDAKGKKIGRYDK